MERLLQITTLEVFGGSHEGMSGKHNEDSYGIFAWKLDQERILHLGVVADGVGGQIAGEIASRVTVETIGNYFDGPDMINNVSGHMEQAILAANEAVYNASQENPDYRGMSTTIALAAVVDKRLYTSHVGDSRIYLLRDGNLKQISIDHTWAQEAIEAGLLTREQAKTHPNRNVIKRHLGGKLQVEVDHRLALVEGQSAEEAYQNQGMPLKAGDIILVCSDGLTDMISDEEALESLSNHFNDLPTATSELIDKANKAGGRDNITVVLMKVPGKEGLPVAATLIQHAPAATTAEPTLITSAPKSARQSKPAITVAPDAPPIVAEPIKGKRRSWRVPVLLLFGIGLLLIVALAAGAYFLFGESLNSTATPTPAATETMVLETPAPTNTPGSPATAAFLATQASSIETGGEGNTAEGAEGAPTLRPTLTPSNTPTRTPIPPPLSTPIPEDTATSPPTIEIPTSQPTQAPPPATSTRPSPTQPPVPTSTKPSSETLPTPSG